MEIYVEANQAARYAMTLLGLPYKWGGQNPLEGFDCSGLVQEILASVGADPKGDQTAQMLFDYFSKSKNGRISEPKCGALSFYGSNHKSIRHIAFCINEYQMIEAAGGDSSTRTLEDASNRGSFVRIRPIMYRLDYIHCIYPYF